MAKNMTRKGLAIGTAFALSSAAMIAVPANAAPGITLNDLNDKGLYSMIEGETFTFLAAGNADFNTNNQTRLRVKITNVNGSDNAPTITVQGTAPDAVNLSTSGTTATALGTTAGDSGVFVDSTAAMSSPFQFTIKAGAMSAGDVEKYDVQVWDDADNDATIDSGEYVSPTRTVTFIESADVVVNHTINAVTQDDTQVTGSFSIAGVDTKQLTITSFSLHLTNGLDGELSWSTDTAGDASNVAGAVALVVAGASGAAADEKLYYDSTNNVFAWKTKATVSAATDVNAGPGTFLKVALAKDTAVKAQALYKSGGSETVSDTLGSDAFRAVAALSLASITADTTDSNTAESANDRFNNTDGTTFGVEAAVVDSNSKAVAGVAVTAKVEVPTGTLGSSDNKLVINNVTYTDETKLPGATGIAEISLTTDADGMVYLSMTATDFAVDDTVKVTFSAQNKSSNIVVTAKAPTYKAYIVNHDEKVVITSGGTAVIDLEVYDQFGGLLPAGYDARALFQSTANFNGSGETASTAAADVNVAISNGKVRLAVTPNGVGTGTTTYDIDIQKRAAGGAYAAAATSVDGLVIESVSALVAPDTITVTNGTSAYGDNADTSVIEITDYNGAGAGTTGQPVEAAKFITFANRAVSGATEPTLNAGFSLAGNLNKKATLTSNSAAAPDQFVTLTANSDKVMFVALVDQNSDNSDEKIYSVGSITVPTDASGNFDVNVHSNVSGKYKVTITSGSASAVVEISVENPATTAGTKLVIDAPAYAAAGSTVIAKATVTDEYGNALVLTANNDGAGDLSLAYSGPGLAVTASADATNSSGVAQVAYFLGANDTGTIVITAKYDANGDEDYADTGDLVESKTITIGSAAAAAGQGTSVKRTGNTVAVRVTGYAKSRIVLNGARVASRSTLGTLSRNLTLRAGRNVIQIVVDGKVIRTVRYTR